MEAELAGGDDRREEADPGRNVGPDRRRRASPDDSGAHRGTQYKVASLLGPPARSGRPRARSRGGHPSDLPAQPLPGPSRRRERRRLQLRSCGRGRARRCGDRGLPVRLGAAPRAAARSGCSRRRSSGFCWPRASGARSRARHAPDDLEQARRVRPARARRRAAVPPRSRPRPLSRRLRRLGGGGRPLGGADVPRRRRRSATARDPASARSRSSATRTTARSRAPHSPWGSPRSRSVPAGGSRVAAVIGGGLGVALDASIFAYLGTILAAIAIVVVTRRLGTLHLRRVAALGAILVVVGSGVFVLRGSDVSNYLSFLGVRTRRPPPTRTCRRASSGRCSSGWAGRCGRTTRSSGLGSTVRTPTSSRTSPR